MFVRIVWQEERSFEVTDMFRDSNGPPSRGADIFPPPGADMRHMTLGLFDR